MITLSTRLKWILDLLSIGVGISAVLWESVMSSDLAGLLTGVVVLVLLALLLVMKSVVIGVRVEATVG